MTDGTRIHVASIVVLLVVLALGAGPATAAPPANDNFSAALPIAVGGEVHGTTLDATAEPNEQLAPMVNWLQPDCALITDGTRCTSSVWYEFTPATSGEYTIETCDFGTDMDTFLGLWTGATLGALTSVDTDDDACAGGLESRGSQLHEVSLTGGTQYHIEVTGFDASQGTFYLRVYSGSPHALPPQPDTHISQRASFVNERLGGGPPSSGPRQTASWAFSSDTAGATFQCSLDGAPFAACASPLSMDGVSGTHSFTVRAVAAGVPDPTPAQQVFTIDNTVPDTSIVSGPPSGSTSDPSPVWLALGTDRSSSGQFQCSFDATPPGTTCGPFFEAGTLCAGTHTFSTAQVDLASNVDPTRATRTITETAGTPCGSAPDLGTVTVAAAKTVVSFQDNTVDVKGEGGAVELQYGPTAAYGSKDTTSVFPNSLAFFFTMRYLQPGTTYHYKLTITTPSGTDTTGDQTITTMPLGGTVLPSVALGAPLPVGNHALALPVSVDPHGADADFGVVIDDKGPATAYSPQINADAAFPAAGGAGTKAVHVVDLHPGIYHVRAFARTDINGEEVLGPDVTVAVPAAPGAGSPLPLPLSPIQKFKFRRSFIKVGKIRRGSKSISLVISHLPPSSSVAVTVKATLKSHASASKVKLLGRGKAKAGKGGVARVKIKLSRKARQVLRNRTRSLSLQVRVKPPGQSTSSITLHRKPRR